MKLLKSKQDLGAWREEQVTGPQTLGFVPTMGALHAGHQFLMERAVEENDRVVLSIFKNPTQFNDPSDLRQYPDTLDADLKMADWMGVDAVFLPGYADLYPDDFQFRVTESALASFMEGVQRPGHFDGVLTVVLKLFLLVRPDRAYFGKKDYQQFELVRQMARAFLLETEVIACATIREADGLACSSRNVHLSPEARERAGQFPKILRSSQTAEQARHRLEHAGFEVEYVEEHFGRRFGAVQMGSVRLIDNVPLRSAGPPVPLTDDESFMTGLTWEMNEGKGKKA